MELNENLTKPLGHNASSTKREVYSSKYLFLKIRKKAQLNVFRYNLKIWKQDETKSKCSQKQEVIKTRVEINEIETKQQYRESMSLTAGSLRR